MAAIELVATQRKGFGIIDMKEVQVFEQKELRILGRCGTYSKDGEQAPALFWTGSGLLCYGTISELWILVEADYDMYEPWISWSVNGADIGRMMVPKGKNWICLVRGMSADIVKTIRVLKDVQAMSADAHHSLIIHSIRYEGVLYPVPEPKMKLEFIGDSITSGEGSIGATCEQDWISMIFSASHDYGVLTADLLNADFRIVSQSGWGTYVSWDNHTEYTLPQHYEKVCGLLWGQLNHELGADLPYDFSAWQPDCVIVNLGTNDRGAFDSPAFVDEKTGERTKMEFDETGMPSKKSVALIEGAVKNFCKTIRKNNPKAHILWVYGMLGQDFASYLSTMIDHYKEENQDENAAFLLLPDSQEEYIGARCHPGLLAHQRAAKEISQYLTKNFTVE